jgi:hypothetical protein
MARWPQRRRLLALRLAALAIAAVTATRGAMFTSIGAERGPRGRPPSFADQMHGDFPRVGRPPMLEKIDSLPGSQSEPAVPDRNGQLQPGQRGADVGGHVVAAFVCVAVSPRLLGRQAGEERLEIEANLSGRVLLNEQTGRGVPAEQGQEPGPHAVGPQPVDDLGRNLDQPAARGRNSKDVDELTHADFRYRC